MSFEIIVLLGKLKLAPTTPVPAKISKNVFAP
jgi:hypothetical protein